MTAILKAQSPEILFMPSKTKPKNSSKVYFRFEQAAIDSRRAPAANRFSLKRFIRNGTSRPSSFFDGCMSAAATTSPLLGRCNRAPNQVSIPASRLRHAPLQRESAFHQIPYLLAILPPARYGVPAYEAFSHNRDRAANRPCPRIQDLLQNVPPSACRMPQLTKYA